MSRKNSRERTLLVTLRSVRLYTEVIGQIFRDLWPVTAVAFSLLGATLHQLVRLLLK